MGRRPLDFIGDWPRLFLQSPTGRTLFVINPMNEPFDTNKTTQLLAHAIQMDVALLLAGLQPVVPRLIPEESRNKSLALVDRIIEPPFWRYTFLRRTNHGELWERYVIVATLDDETFLRHATAAARLWELDVDAPTMGVVDVDWVAAAGWSRRA